MTPPTLKERLDAMVREKAIANGDGPSFGYNSQAWADAIQAVSETLLARVDALEGAAQEVLDHPACSDPDCCKKMLAHTAALDKLRAALDGGK